MAPPQYLTNAAFSCGVCCDDQPQGEPFVLAAGDPVCKECYLTGIKPQFEAALQNEANYPVTWANDILDPRNFPDMNDEFLGKWKKKVKEYNTEQKYRLYCKQHQVIGDPAQGNKAQTVKGLAHARKYGKETKMCSKYLGDLRELKGEFVSCRACNGYTCVHVAMQWSQEAIDTKPDDITKHKCDPSTFSKVKEMDPSLVRGVDYQLCPQCQIPVNLRDGCNAMVCTCRIHFCYICGQRAHHDSKHYEQGRPCPRWNQPGTPQAAYDRRNHVYWSQEDAEPARWLRRAVGQQKTKEGQQAKLDQANLADIITHANALGRRSWKKSLLDFNELLYDGLEDVLIDNDPARWQELSPSAVEGHVREIADAREKLLATAPAIVDLYPQAFEIYARYEKIAAGMIERKKGVEEAWKAFSKETV